MCARDGELLELVEFRYGTGSYPIHSVEWLSCVCAASPSSSGLGHRPFTAVTRVRIPSGTPIKQST